MSKSDTVIKLLLRAKGASPIELIAATDWQPHSVYAFLSGLRKKGREVIRDERKGGGYAYRIVADKAGAPNEAVAGPRSEAASTDAVASTNAASEARVSGHDAPDDEYA